MTAFSPNKIVVPFNGNFSGQLEFTSGSRLEVANQPANGTFTLNPIGGYSYVPNPGFVGVDAVAWIEFMKIPDPTLIFIEVPFVHVIEVNVLPESIDMDNLTPEPEVIVNAWESSIPNVQGEISVSTALPHYQSVRSAVLNDGSYVTVFSGVDSETSMDGVYFRLYDAMGRVIDGSNDLVPVNSTAVSEVRDFSITSLSAGGFVVTWEESGKVWWRAFDNDGAPTTGEIDFLPTLPPLAGMPRGQILELDDGSLLAVSLHSGMRITHFNVDGTVIDNPVLVQPYQVSFSGGSISMGDGLDAALLSNGNVVLTGQLYGGSSGYNFSLIIDPSTGAVVRGAELMPGTVNIYSRAYFVPQVIATDDGGYFAIYGQDDVSPRADIFIQRYDAAGSEVGSPVMVTETTIKSVARVSEVIELETGGFLVVWFEGDAAGTGIDRWDIFAREYDANGAAVDGIIAISQEVYGVDQDYPTVVQLEDGKLVFHWTRDDGADHQVLRAVYERNAVDGTFEIVTNGSLFTDSSHAGVRTYVQALADGGYVSMFTAQDPSSPLLDNVHFQVFDENHNATTSILAALDTPVVSVRQANVFAVSNGGFGVSWYDSTSQKSYFKGFDDTGIARTGAIDVTDGTSLNTASQSEIAVLELPTGNLAAVWASEFGGGIYLTQFDLNGNRLTAPVLLDIQDVPPHSEMSATMLADGNIALSWTGDGDGSVYSPGVDVGTVIIDAAGQLVSTVTEVVVDTDGPFEAHVYQGISRVAALDNGGYVVALVSGSSPIYFKVHYRVYDADGVEVTPSLQLVATTSASSSADVLTDVVALHDGGFMLVWSADVAMTYPNENPELFAQRYAADGTPAGDVFQLNDVDTGMHRFAGITQLDNGDVVANWAVADKSNYYGPWDIVQRTFTPAKGTVGYDMYGSVGKDVLAGSVHDDVMHGLEGDDFLAAWTGDDQLNGGAGNDRLEGYLGDDLLNGGGGNDFLDGGEGVDILNGDAGDDELWGWLGDDQLNGGSGDDRLYGQGGNDTLNGGADDDYLSGGDGVDILNGDAGDDILYGDVGDDSAYGGAGNDNLYGWTGDDILEGNDGDDNLYGEEGDDFLSGGDGNDFLDGGLGFDTLSGGLGSDHLNGWDGDDALYGDDGSDTLIGGAGNDQLIGGSGGDSLDGGVGDDFMQGGSGTDVLYGWTGDDILMGGAGVDFLYGQDGNDTYFFELGGSQDNIFNQDMVGHDTLEFGGGIEKVDVWFSRVGDDLFAEILDTSDEIIFDSWYADSGAQIDEFVLDDGSSLSQSGVETLVTAMASFDPSSLGSVNILTDLPKVVQDAIAASWS